MKLLTKIICCLALFAAGLSAAAQSTVEFTAAKTILEDDPNAGTYCFTLYSPDGEWKVQMLYHSSDGMFGTFGNEDFDLAGSGKSYNYARNPQNDMVFYSFRDMSVTVSDETTSYHIAADCTTASGTRFIIQGSVDALIPTATVESDLGYAYIVENPFYETYTFSAENDDYRLAYGIVGHELCGTFYRADILLPELTDKRSGEAIKVASATATHTAEGETTHLAIDIISEDLTLYRFTMYNAPLDIDVTEEVTVNLGLGCVLQDLRDMYGCYQVAGQNTGFAAALAFKPEAFERSTPQWTKDDFFMPYTKLIRLFDNTEETIVDINATGHTEPHLLTIVADVLCMSGRLYHIAMGVTDDEYMPEGKETVDINFGHVAVVDYSAGLGTIGLGAVQQGKYQLRFAVRAHELEGEWGTRDIDPDFTYIMVVNEETHTYSFHDAQVFKAKAIKAPNGRTMVEVNMLATNNVMYHALMYVDDLQCMHDADYDISSAAGASMVAMQMDADGDYAEYNLQYQILPADYNPMLPISDGQIFSFYFAHRGPGLAGEYGYSAGTLADDETHTFYEHGTEIRLAPMAGTLNIRDKDKVIVNFDGTRYTTNIYDTEFHFVGQNGVTYNAAGDNYLFCIDTEGNMVDITEPFIDAIAAALSDRGYAARKLISEGRVLITTPDGTYNAAGTKVSTTDRKHGAAVVK